MNALWQTKHGWEIIKMQVNSCRDEAIVLVRIPGGSPTYATFQMVESGDCIQGDYFTDYNDARIAYDKRCYREG